MKVNKLKALLSHLYSLALLPSPVYVPVLIWGEAGVGKTQTVKEAVRLAFSIDEGDDEAVSEHLRDLRIGNMDPSDLIGVPAEQLVYPCPICHANGQRGRRYESNDLVQHIRAYAKKDKDHRKIVDTLGSGSNISVWAHKEVAETCGHLISTRTVFSMPDWFPVDEPASDGKKGGILFLDEINRGQKDTIQAVFQLVLDRRLHLHDLPPDWIVVAASNPSNTKGGRGKYVVADEFTKDNALMTRFLHVGIEPDVQDWLNYASQRRLDDSIRFLVASNQSMFDYESSILSFRIVATPRTWDFLNRILVLKIDNDLLADIAAGLVGPDKALVWSEIRRTMELPISAIDMLDHYQDGMTPSPSGPVPIRQEFMKQLRERDQKAHVALDGLWRHVMSMYNSGKWLTQDQVHNIAIILRDTFDFHPETALLYFQRDDMPPGLRGPLYQDMSLAPVVAYSSKFSPSSRGALNKVKPILPPQKKHP